VITVPCVGDADYLNSEFNELREQDGSYVDTTNTVTRDIVIIDSFQRDSTKKFIFGKPYIEFLNTYRLFKECNFEVDLLYATKTLYTVLEHWHQLSHQFEHLMYIHTGGLTGNSSQLERYNREGLTRL
jgi:1-aminocyclopropane-1-carboxylate deaminase